VSKSEVLLPTACWHIQRLLDLGTLTYCSEYTYISTRMLPGK